MKSRSRVKVGNVKNNPGYRTPSSFRNRKNITISKPKSNKHKNK